MHYSKNNFQPLPIVNQHLETRIIRFLLIAAGTSLFASGVAVLTSERVDNILLPLMSSLMGRTITTEWLGRLHRLGMEALLRSGIFVAGWLVLLRQSIVVSLSRKKRLLLVIAASVLVLIWLPAVLMGRNAVIGGARYWWLGDDAMISMRYARNLADGMGLVWNPAERVEGYTNFLWTLFMALVHLFPISDSQTSLVVLIANIAIAVATIPVIVRLVGLLGGSSLATAATVVSYIFSKHVIAWAMEAGETILLTFLFLLSTYRILRESKLNRPRFLTYLLIAMMSLVRADAIVLSIILYAFSAVLNRRQIKAVLVYSSASLLLPTAHVIFRLYYYGDILPNTAYLKVMNWQNRYANGLNYVLNFAQYYAVALAFAIIGSLRGRTYLQRALFGIILVYAAYLVFIGGDAFKSFRFFVPLIPLLTTLAFLGIQNLSRRLAPRLALTLIGLAAIALVLPGYSNPGYDPIFYPDPYDVENVKVGLLLKHNTSASSKVAGFWAGAAFYFSERYGVDLLGKSDRHIAHLPVTDEGAKAGHNKFDFAYSLGVLKPDLVIADFRLPDTEDKKEWATMDEEAFDSSLYHDRVFREHCLPYPVSVESWNTIFICDWSAEMDKRENRWELQFGTFNHGSFVPSIRHPLPAA